MENRLSKHKFKTFDEAMIFLDVSRKLGRHGILIPNGGYHPHNWRKDKPVEWIVLLLEE